jgi:hypothetical protein
MRITPPPAGVTLPKETVHLEVTIPRDDIDDERGMAAPAPLARPGKPAPPPKPKKIARKPIVLHVFAVPDGGATWLGVGLDGKLVAQKAAAALAAAPDANSLGKAHSGYEALREGKLNSGGIATLRGLMVFAALGGSERSPYSLLGSLPGKGATPIVFTGHAEGPSATAKAGSSVGTLHVSRAVIDDIVKLAMAAH